MESAFAVLLKGLFGGLAFLFLLGQEFLEGFDYFLELGGGRDVD